MTWRILMLVLLAASAHAQVGSPPGVTGGASVQADYAQASGANLATVGSELATNASFDTDLTGWTGTNWAWAAGGKALHTAGSTTALSQNVTITSGVSYMVTFNVSGGTAGTIDIALGSQSVRTAVITGAIHSGDTKYILSTQTGSVALTATPTTDFNGNLDYFGLQAFTAEHGVAFELKDTAGTLIAPFRVNVDFPNTTNLFIGYDSGRWSSGNGDTYAIGTSALRNTGWNGVGYRNMAFGAYSMLEATTGIENVAMGHQSLMNGTSATRNVAIGRQALSSLRSGQNTAVGFQAMSGAVYANNNVAIGPGTLTSVSASAAFPTGGSGNTAIGAGGSGGGPGFNYNGGGATLSVTTGTFNTLVGSGSGQCTATQRTGATVLGYNACFDADNVVVIGNQNVTDVILGHGPATAAAPYTFLRTRGVRGGFTKTLTDGAAAATAWQCALPTAGFLGGEIIWAVSSTDATDHRDTTGRVRIAGVNKAGTNTCTINVVGTDLTASSNANTLVCTWTNVASGANCNVSVTCTDNTGGSQTMSMVSFSETPHFGTACTPQ